jgi:transposase
MAAAATAPFSTDTDLFRLFVTEALVPAPRHGDVVIWDGLAPHKAAGLADALHSAGAELMPLPPYSPDLSPIEPCWSKVKEIVRSAEPRDEGAIDKVAAKAFAAVTSSDTRGWFRHCGYVVH